MAGPGRQRGPAAPRAAGTGRALSVSAWASPALPPASAAEQGLARGLVPGDVLPEGGGAWALLGRGKKGEVGELGQDASKLQESCFLLLVCLGALRHPP